MALELVGRYIAEADFVTTGSLISLTSLSGGLASQPAEGDLIVVDYGATNNTDAALGIKDASDVDYEIVGSELYADDDYDANMRVAYKFAGSTPDTQVKISSSPQGYAGIIMVSVWRGVDPSTPLDVAAVTSTGTNSPFADPGAITPSTSGAVILAFGIGGVSTFASVYSDPGDLTDFQSLDNDYSGLGGRSTVGGMGYKAWTSGSFNPTSWSTSGGSQFSWAAMTLALRPAPAVAEGTASITLADAALAASGTVVADGSASITLAAASLSAPGTVLVGGSLSSSLDDAALASSGTVLIAAAASVSLAEMALAATGTAPSNSLTVTLDDATLAAAGVVPVVAVAALSLADATIAGTGVAPIQAAGSLSLADAAATAAGTVAITAAGSIALEGVSSSAAGVLPIEGSLTATLDDAALAAAGGNFILVVTPPGRRLALAESGLAHRRLALATSRLVQRRLVLTESRLAQRRLQIVE